MRLGIKHSVCWVKAHLILCNSPIGHSPSYKKNSFCFPRMWVMIFCSIRLQQSSSLFNRSTLCKEPLIANPSQLYVSTNMFLLYRSLTGAKLGKEASLKQGCISSDQIQDLHAGLGCGILVLHSTSVHSERKQSSLVRCAWVQDAWILLALIHLTGIQHGF